MDCQRCLADPRGVCFKHKLRSIQWGPSTQNPGSRRNYYDNDALIDQGFGKPEIMDARKEALEGVDLRWDRGTPYNRDKIGDWVEADEKTMQRVMYGRPEKNSRSFGFGARSDTG